MADLEKQKLKIKDTKLKIQRREKLLKEKEKLANQTTLSLLGELFVKAKVSHLDHETLLGALIEISEKSNDEKYLKDWKEKSKQLIKKKNQRSAMTITFKTQPPFEIREQLKDINFKWNSFRGEYYGYGDANEVTSLLKEYLDNHDCKIETR